MSLERYLLHYRTVVLMLELEFNGVRYFNEKTEEIVTVPYTKYELEHSLLSVFHWESKWKRSFLKILEMPEMEKISNQELTEMLIDYIGYMIVSYEGELETYRKVPISEIDFAKVLTYINDSQTATTIHDASPKRAAKQILTAEYIYGLMVNLRIPFECQTWHLNRLLTLISVVNIQRDPGKKRSKRDTIAEYAKLNQQRLAKYGKG